MAADVQVKLEDPNPCCDSWKKKYAVLENRRNSLRQAVKLLEQEITMNQTKAKIACEGERARADFEKQEKEKESAAKLALENEIAELKSEILSLQRNQGGDVRGDSDEVKLLQSRVSEGEREINRLKDAVQAERKRADLEKKNAEAEKKKGESKADSNVVKVEKEKAEKYMLQIEVLKKESDELKSKLALETVKLKEANKKLEAEKQKAAKEKKRADLEKGKAEKMYTEKESLSRKLEESKKRMADTHESKLVSELSAKLEEANKKLQSEKQKAAIEKARADGAELKAEAQRKKAMEEKSRSDQLHRELEEGKKKINEMAKKINELKHVKPHGSSTCESKDRKLFKKELRLEKKNIKHYKQVVELERSRTGILQQELGRLKLEFDQLSGRLGLLHKSLSPKSNDLTVQMNGHVVNMAASDMKNIGSSELFKMFLQNQKELLKPSFPTIEASGSFGQMCPLPGGYCIEPVTGTTRTMLQSPAINSSVTSFSNKNMVGSQDSKGASGLSDEANQMKSVQNRAIVAENCIQPPVGKDNIGKATGRSKKRKRIPDTVETVENLYLTEKKRRLQLEEELAVLHDAVNPKMGKGFGEGKFPHHNKIREIPYQEKVVNTELKDRDEVKSKADGNMRESNGEGLEIMSVFEKQANGDYMDLLKLDDSFEKCYREAMDTPLSPTLPEIEFVNEAAFEKLLNKEEKELILQNSGDVDSEIILNASLVHTNENSVNSLGIGADVHPKHISIANDSGDGRSRSDCGVVNLSKRGQEHCVLFCKTTDRSSISRMYRAIRCCTAQCLLTTRKEWMVREILLAITADEQLVAKEKLCAVFSLLTINFTVTAFGGFGDCINWASVPCMDSFAPHVRKVLSDAEIGMSFAQVGGLDELLNLIEDFLVDGSLMVLRDASCISSIGSDFSVNVDFDGSDIMLSSSPVSSEQLVASGIMLASICSAIDHIGFICETSYNILRARRLSKSIMLSILHIFAHLSGDKFFFLSDYSLMMTVLKPVIRNVEAVSLSGSSVCCNSCTRCPFLEDSGSAVAITTVTSLLLEKIKANNNVEMNNHVVEPHSSKYDVFGNNSDTFVSSSLLSLSDLLALLELIACYMGWEWTSNDIVPPLLKLLESCNFRSLNSGVVILLGQLGRLGVEAVGHEEKKIEELRNNLSAFLQRGMTEEAVLPIQIATVTALLGLISVDFQTIVQENGKLPAIASQSASTDLLRKWFSSLSKKHRDLSLNVLQASTVHK